MTHHSTRGPEIQLIRRTSTASTTRRPPLQHACAQNHAPKHTWRCRACRKQQVGQSRSNVRSGKWCKNNCSVCQDNIAASRATSAVTVGASDATSHTHAKKSSGKRGRSEKAPRDGSSTRLFELPLPYEAAGWAKLKKQKVKVAAARSDRRGKRDAKETKEGLAGQ